MAEARLPSFLATLLERFDMVTVFYREEGGGWLHFHTLFVCVFLVCCSVEASLAE